MSATLIDLLTQSPHLHVRAIASRLNLRSKGQNRKQDWIQAVADLLANSATRQPLLHDLSPAARQALQRLTEVESLPALLFLNQYGPLRLPGDPAQTPVAAEGVRIESSIVPPTSAPPAWRAPQSAAEELFYCGLLFPAGDPPDATTSLAKATRVQTPAPLRSALAAELHQLASADAPPAAEELPVADDAPVDTPLPPDLPMPDADDEPSVVGLRQAQAAGDASVAEPVAATAQSAHLLHDLCQLLIYLHQQPAPKLLHDRWLPPLHVQALQERLLLPAPRPPPRSHKQASWPAFLMFLSHATGLQSRGHVTAYGWQWLGWSPAQQLQGLWRYWLEAPTELRQAYAQPAGHLPPLWLQLVCRHLYKLLEPAESAKDRRLLPTTPLSIQLANAILAERAFDPFFVANFFDLDAVDTLLAHMVAETLHFWGLWQNQGDALRLTPTGRLLLAPLAPAAEPAADGPERLLSPAAWHWLSGADKGTAALAIMTEPAGQIDEAATLHAVDASSAQPVAGPVSALHITVSLLAAPRAVAALAGFAAVPVAWADVAPSEPPSNPVDTPPAAAMPNWLPRRAYTYRLTAHSVGAAASRQRSLPRLLEALGELGLPAHALPVGPLLQQWYSAGGQVWLGHLPILQTQDAAHMAQIQQHPELRPYLSQLYSPTVALWRGDQARFLAALAKAGFFPSPAADASTLESATPESSTQEPAATAPAADGHMAPAAADAFTLPLEQAGALWLAGQSYLLLGEHLPTPIPLYTGLLDAIYAARPPAEQASLQAQLQQLREHLRNVLDHLPYTPPPQPSDPARWRRAIAQAIARQQPLHLVYFSAGRNLRTARTVDPYWIEEHNGIPYLRAWCHNAQRVLTFRLDRIEACEAEEE